MKIIIYEITIINFNIEINTIGIIVFRFTITFIF